MLEIWREVASDARGVAIPDGGHYLPEEQPEAVAEALLAFAAGRFTR